MDEVDPQDLTKPLMEPDAKVGKWEEDPKRKFVQRFVPTDDERKRIESYLKTELDNAVTESKPNTAKKLRLLDAYRAEPNGRDEMITFPLIKRAARRKANYAKRKIASQRPMVTLRPETDRSIDVLVPDQTLGMIPVTKTAEDMATSGEWYMENKLRKMGFVGVLNDACLEATRGQEPWFKIVVDDDYRLAQEPEFTPKGMGVTFETKRDRRVPNERVRIELRSGYSMLAPAYAQDHETAPWIAERLLPTTDDLRAYLANGDGYLIPKEQWKEMLEGGAEAEMTEDEARKGQAEKRIPTTPPNRHNVFEVPMFWTIPNKEEWYEPIAPTADNFIAGDFEPGEGLQHMKKRTRTVNVTYPMVARFHLKLGKLLSFIRSPFEHGLRMYEPLFERKEPLRLAGDSTAEESGPYQHIIAKLTHQENKAGIVATTPVAFVQPGSMAGEWVSEHQVEPGSVIPRMRPEEVEVKNLGSRDLSLLGLIEFHNREYEKQTSLGEPKLGTSVTSHVPASTMAQVISEADSDSDDFVETVCEVLSRVMKKYLLTVQQYMREGEVIPFMPETADTIRYLLSGEESAPSAVTMMPMRFPMTPITDDFSILMTASSHETQQDDAESLTAMKRLVDEDGAIVAQMISALPQLIAAASQGQIPQQIVDIVLEDFKRRQRLMELIGRARRKDGALFAIPTALIQSLVDEQRKIAEMQAAQQQQQQAMGAPNGPQGTGPVGEPGGVPNDAGALGEPVQQPGVPSGPLPDQAQASEPTFGVPV